MTIAPIETRYAGCRFRSRLEARWAVFLDHLGLSWDYEPQGFHLPSGSYLPDFWLPGVQAGGTVGVWLEIKPADDQGDDERWFEFVGASRQPLVIGRGIGRNGDEPEMEAIEPVPVDLEFNPAGSAWDNYRQFCICPACRQIGVTFSGRLERLTCCPGNPGGRDGAGHPRILNAFAAARSARFEYGECG